MAEQKILNKPFRTSQRSRKDKRQQRNLKQQRDLKRKIENADPDEVLFWTTKLEDLL